MRRVVALGAVLAVGLGSIGVAALQRQGGRAQGPPVVEVDRLQDNLFVLRGGGGNTAVFVTTNGVVVVDAKNPGWGQPILDKIGELTPKPVTTLINTHTHGDHVSGNVAFPATVEVVTQENTKAHMDAMPIFSQNAGRGLPKRTFTDKLTLFQGPDQVDLYYFGPGHTDGDAFVVFPAHRTAHTGDLFPGKQLPLVDADNGGSVLRYADTLNKAHAGIPDVDTIISGHSPTPTTWADLKTFAELNQDFLTWAQAQLRAGRTPEQAAPDWTMPEKYVGYNPTPPAMFGGVAGRLQRLADETR